MTNDEVRMTNGSEPVPLASSFRFSRSSFLLLALLATLPLACGEPPLLARQDVTLAAATPATRTASAPALSRFTYAAIKLGSDFNIVLYASDKPTADAAAGAVFARVDQLNAVLSDYDPESELSRLSRRAHDGPMAQPAAVSRDLWNVLDTAREAFDKSGGAFDVTVGPYVQLWRRSKRQQELPTPERLAEARSAVGFDKLNLDPTRRSALLTAARMRLDVGGIATGYISDECIRLLRRRGINSALIDASGDLAMADPPPGRAGWRVAIQSLTRPKEVAGYVELANCGLSTSGDTYRFVEVDGVRYSHIVDPRTGLGLTRRIGVSVVAPDGITADWMSTAVSVLGPEKGLELVESVPGAAARITTLDGETVNVVTSKRYIEVVRPAGEP